LSAIIGEKTFLFAHYSAQGKQKLSVRQHKFNPKFPHCCIKKLGHNESLFRHCSMLFLTYDKIPNAPSLYSTIHLIQFVKHVFRHITRMHSASASQIARKTSVITAAHSSIQLISGMLIGSVPPSGLIKLPF